MRARRPVDPRTRLLARCQCCPSAGMVFGIVQGHRLLIRAPRAGDLHRVMLTEEDVGLCVTTGPLLCQCCPLAQRKILGEWRDGLLILRGKRHGRAHFLALTPERLRTLLAFTPPTEYS